jgi:hypothetical protein
MMALGQETRHIPLLVLELAVKKSLRHPQSQLQVVYWRRAAWRNALPCVLVQVRQGIHGGCQDHKKQAKRVDETAFCLALSLRFLSVTSSAGRPLDLSRKMSEPAGPVSAMRDRANDSNE